MLTPRRIYQLSEKALTVEWEPVIHPAVAAEIRRFLQELKAQPFPGLTELVPAYATLTIFYDPCLIREHHPGQLAAEWVQNRVWEIIHASASLPLPSPSRRIEIPVQYGGEYGPDLEEVATHCGLSPAEVITRHSQAVYQVYMLGFVPGFAYMGGLPETLHTPRKTTPRAQVSAGSVGIAGAQTGIYPMTIPGGWQIIGRTPVLLFDKDQNPPAFLQAGDEIQFIPVNTL